MKNDEQGRPNFLFSAADDVLAAVPHTFEACPGHPQYGSKAIRFQWPDGTIVESKPSQEYPAAAYIWALPDGRRISADYYYLVARFRK